MTEGNRAPSAVRLAGTMRLTYSFLRCAIKELSAADNLLKAAGNMLTEINRNLVHRKVT
jgi:hypothetical protein